MTNMPFTDLPTMLIGIDMYQKVGKTSKYVIGMIGTVDRNFGRYHS